MAKVKISELTALGTNPDEADIIPIVDTDAGITKKITVEELMGNRETVNLSDTGIVTWTEKWKIGVDGTSLVFYYWTGSAWAEYSRFEKPV